MMLKTLYHNAAQKARGTAEILTVAGAVALAGAAIASACMMIGAGERQDAPRVMAAAPERAEIAETAAAEVIRYGTPYTTEYDYGLETEQETSAGVTYGADRIESGPRVELPASTAVDAPALAGPAIEEDSDAEEDVEPDPEPEPQESAPVGAWTETDEAYARMIAQVLWGECRGCSSTEQAAVAWCVLNRVDSPERYFPDDVAAVIVQPSQFLGYAPDNPVTDELYKVSRDVLSRWYAERAGAADVGRVLPRGYCYFRGDGKHNYFTTEWKGADVWDWSLGTPYGEG